MMQSVDVAFAKAHLSALLERVAEGGQVLITSRGKPVARLVPAGPTRQAEPTRVAATVDRLRALRRTMNLNGLDWKRLRDRGRR